LYKPYRSYIYKAELKEDGTFDMTQPNGWKVVNTNMLFDANGNLCQSKDVLDKVSAQHMGYGNSNAISTVTNAMWLNSVFEGAENTYVSSINKKMLEGDRVQLGEATVFKQDDCEKLFEKKTLTVNTNSGPLKAFKVTIPANPAYNVPFAKINVTFNAGTQPTRKLFVSLKDNGDFEVITDQGEEFNGFLVFRNPYNPTQSWLIFDWSVFSSFVPVSGFDSQSFIVSYSESQSEYVDLTIFNSCSINQKEYQLPLNSCFGEVHTGEYGFKLLPHKIGTIFEIKKGSVPYDEMTRKYKAMVWVHNTSPQKTTLKVDNGSIYSATLEQPYVVAGNWSLLRINFEASAKANIKVYVENNSDDGVAVYDDIRVLPYQADMNNYVYDHRFNYVTSTLDSDHFATWANYDSRGRVTKSTVELENIGKKTVKKQLFNDQKID
jgi:hypothetical protein